MTTVQIKKSGFMKVLFLMLLVTTLMWNCSENSRKCVEFEVGTEEIEGIEITTTECATWADELTKTTD
jgi:hypothetical protein